MSAQLTRNPTDSGQSIPPSAQLSNEHDKERNEGMTPWGESPDLLRWRADMLMDEMMLGGVDVYAGEPKAATLSPSAVAYQASTGNRPRGNPAGNPAQFNSELSQPLSELRESASNETPRLSDAFLVNGSPMNAPPVNASPVNAPQYRTPSPAKPSESAFYESGRAAQTDKATPSQSLSSQLPPAQSSPTQSASGPSSSSSPSREPKAWVFSAEARYQQIARDQQTTSNADNNLVTDFTSSAPLPASAPRWMPEEASSLPITSLPINRGESHGASVNSGTLGPELGPVRRTSAQMASAMVTPTQSGSTYGATGGGPNRNGKWSNLLPRMSTTDVQTLQQEIATLHSEINALLPRGHESNQRAQHLLEKAQTILENDPTRSAEVEYYLQQVRMIFQRVQQTIHWSTLYRNRLLIYLTGWSLLAIIVIIARYLYEPQIGGLIADLLQWTADSFAAQNFTTWLTTIASGALGGAAGALLNLRLRSHLEHGFFDRKYGLRGLILPIMGILFGLVLYLLIGPLFYLLNIDPSVNVTMSTLPSLLSFAFGLGQEFIYGTRG